MKDRFSRHVVSYRLEKDTIVLIKEASDKTGLSQGEIIENCVLEKLEEVVKKSDARKELKKSGAEDFSRELGSAQKAEPKPARP